MPVSVVYLLFFTLFVITGRIEKGKVAGVDERTVYMYILVYKKQAYKVLKIYGSPRVTKTMTQYSSESTC